MVPIRGDMLSFLLFGIIDDFLSRYLSSFVSSSYLLPMLSPKGFQSLTHLLYADDVLPIYCS